MSSGANEPASASRSIHSGALSQGLLGTHIAEGAEQVAHAHYCKQTCEPKHPDAGLLYALDQLGILVGQCLNQLRRLEHLVMQSGYFGDRFP